MESVQLINTYSTLFTVSLCVCIAGFLLSVITAIVFNIPLVFMQITGLEQRRFAGKVRGSYEKLSDKGRMSDSHSGARKVKIEGGSPAQPAPAKAEVRPASAETTLMTQTAVETTLITQTNAAVKAEESPSAQVTAPPAAEAEAPKMPEEPPAPITSRATVILTPVDRDTQKEISAKPPVSEESDFLIIQRIYCVHTEETL